MGVATAVEVRPRAIVGITRSREATNRLEHVSREAFREVLIVVIEGPHLLAPLRDDGRPKVVRVGHDSTLDRHRLVRQG